MKFKNVVKNNKLKRQELKASRIAKKLRVKPTGFKQDILSTGTQDSSQSRILFGRISTETAMID